MHDDLYFAVPQSFTTTLLYPLPLIGVGTAAVESLHCYMFRLAHEHRLTSNKLATEVLSELAQSQAERNALVAWHRRNGKAMLTANYMARPIVNLLSRATGQQDFEQGTLLPFEHLLLGNSVEAEQRYCPVCVQEDVQLAELPYERLLWRLAGVRCCPLHEVRLQYVDCSGAQKERAADRHSIALHRGVCKHCGAIGFECNRPPVGIGTTAPTRDEVARARGTADMLAAAGRISQTDAATVKSAMLAHAAKVEGGLAGVAARSGHAKTTLWEWANDDEARTALPTYEAIAASEGISVVGLMTADHTLRSQEHQMPSRTRRTRAKIDAALIRSTMQAALDSSNGTIAGVVTQLRLDKSTLRSYEPQLYRLLSARSATRVAVQREHRHQNAIGEAVRVLLRFIPEGVTPSLRNAAKLTNTTWMPGMLKSKALVILRARLLGEGPGYPGEGLLGNAFRLELEKAEERLRMSLSALPVPP